MKIVFSTLKCTIWIALACLTGCVANDDSQLQIRHVFDKQMTHDSAGFEFVLIWYLPPSELVRRQQNSLIAKTGVASKSAQVSRFSINNETRLKLEDIAIQRLETELESNQMCPHGYTIEQIKWLERSIGFIGECQ
ncbi:MAG: hypothetical protein ABJV04_07550 [Aliiglaciecola sp.]|uniref:hypothetical protein n=1 Tax=Aliiglaciecola sp. TaxID=1872441 RepID=UPI003298713A